MLGNPYTPGAGCVPPFLAGRDKLLDAAGIALERLKSGYPQRPILYYGLRGVGKTAMLNAIEEFADNHEIIYEHIEATEERQFIKRLATTLGRFARSMAVSESLKEMKSRFMKLLESFNLAYNLTDNKISVSISPDDIVSSGDLTDDLTGLMVALGKLADKSDNALCIFIDEIQFLEKENARALVSALHRCNQLRLPVTACCAGLPKAMEILNRSCSYSERMFEYVFVDKLTDEEAKAAAAEPANDLGVLFKSDALKEVVATTSGYPYFIQEYCSVIWDSLDEGTNVISLSDVITAKSVFFDRLDRGFFGARYSRSSPSERKFLVAMSTQAKLPCKVSDVADCLGKDVQQISPLRATLIDKGIIYAPARGEVDFTVPLFSEYLSRVVVDE